jgi:hypothetical protein
MKLLIRLVGPFIFLLLSTFLWAQKQERQVGDTTYYKTLIPEEKQGLLKNVNVIANMNFALRNEFVDGEYTQTRFRNEQFRLEIRGQVHEKVYFRFRDRFPGGSPLLREECLRVRLGAQRPLLPLWRVPQQVHPDPDYAAIHRASF